MCIGCIQLVPPRPHRLRFEPSFGLGGAEVTVEQLVEKPVGEPDSVRLDRYVGEPGVDQLLQLEHKVLVGRQLGDLGVKRDWWSRFSPRSGHDPRSVAEIL